MPVYIQALPSMIKSFTDDISYLLDVKGAAIDASY